MLSPEMDWLARWALYAPASIAFQDGDHLALVYTYADLYFLSCVLAKKLESDFDILRGDRVAILSTNELEYAALFFACQRLGAILVPINFRQTSRDVDHVLKDCEPKLFVFQEAFGALPLTQAPAQRWSLEAVRIFTCEALRSRVVEDQSWSFKFVGEFDDACMILYTAGTTGAPKGVVITNKMVHWNSLNTGLRLNLQQSDTALGFLPFFHTSGWNVLTLPFIHRGARTILMRKFNAEKALELTESQRVTVMFGIPTILEMMCRSPKFAEADLTSARYVVVGGEPMPIELIHRYQRKGIPVRQGFGLTEFGPSVFSLNEEDAIRKIGSVGFPNFYVEARLVDDESNNVAAGEIGELILRGDVCTPGYWRNVQATDEAIRDGWFFTGDLMRKDEDGYFYVVGRKKEMFISGGENVYPVEIERHLSTHPAVREVAVVGVPDDIWGEVGKAFISTTSPLTSTDVQVFCREGLAKYKIPKHVAFLENLPKSPTGKILKSALV